MTVHNLADRRRARQERQARQVQAGIAEASAELHARANHYLAEGRPELAQPYLDEAQVFDEAKRPKAVGS